MFWTDRTTVLSARLALLAVVVSLATLIPGGPAQADVVLDNPPVVGHADGLSPVVIKRSVHWQISPALVDWVIEPPTGPENRSFEVQISRSSMRAKSQRSWQPHLTAHTRLALDVPLRAGTIVCVRLRQTSYEVTTTWSASTCVVRPADDRQLKRVSGRIERVRDKTYADGKARIMKANTRLVIGRVPAHSWIGAVWTDTPRHSDRGCGWPQFHLNRDGTGQRRAGQIRGRITWLASQKTPKAGRFSLFNRRLPETCPIGGALVIPPWMPGQGVFSGLDRRG